MRHHFRVTWKAAAIGGRQEPVRISRPHLMEPMVLAVQGFHLVREFLGVWRWKLRLGKALRLEGIHRGVVVGRHVWDVHGWVVEVVTIPSWVFVRVVYVNH